MQDSIQFFFLRLELLAFGLDLLRERLLLVLLDCLRFLFALPSSIVDICVICDFDCGLCLMSLMDVRRAHAGPPAAGDER